MTRLLALSTAAAVLAAASAFAQPAAPEAPASPDGLVINGERIAIPDGEAADILVRQAMEHAAAALADAEFELDLEIDGEMFQGSDMETFERAMEALHEAMGELRADMPEIEVELARAREELSEALAEADGETRRHVEVRIHREAAAEAAREARHLEREIRVIAREARRNGIAAGLAGMEAGLLGIDEALRTGTVDDRGEERAMTEEEREKLLEARAALEAQIAEFREEHADLLGESGERSAIRIRTRAPEAGADRIRIIQEDGRTRYFRNGEELTGDDLTAFLNSREAGRLAGAPDANE